MDSRSLSLAVNASIFDPFVFRRGARARNRIALAPMTNLQSHEDGRLGDAEYDWLVRRARGGFGIIETCASHVSLAGRGFEGQLGCHDDALLPGLSRLAAGIREHGSLSLVQLYHGGARSPSAITGMRPVSASEFEEATRGFERPRTLEEGEIKEVLRDFVAAAKRCEAAGFDGIEVHAAHGYLFSQFLSTAMNLRTDAWGGSLENRARLLRRCVQSIRASTRSNFIVGVRLSPEDFGYARGLDLDETLQVASWMVEDGVDFVHASLWTASLNTKKRPDEHAVPLFRNVLGTSVALFVAGKIWTPDEAQALLDMGADFCALGRSAILNPDWPREARVPDWAPDRLPMSPAMLHERAVSPRFVDYLRGWRGFVADGP